MKIDEIVVISGKGGTGKTTITASIVPYLEDLVIADCDVDAPDLYILLKPEIVEKNDFISAFKAEIDKDRCIKCRNCLNYCKFDAINDDIVVNSMRCEGCGVCKVVCPADAIVLKQPKSGEYYISKTEYGDMVHAKLIPGEENSGKLVSVVRTEAKKIAKKNGAKYILVDGSPGIGCNVISSITGATKVIIVTEPTVSGVHDMERVYSVVKQFSIPTIVIINRYDISISMSEKIEQFCKKEGIEVNLKIPLEKEIVKSITDEKIPSLYKKDIFKKIGFDNFIENCVK